MPDRSLDDRTSYGDSSPGYTNAYGRINPSGGSAMGARNAASTGDPGAAKSYGDGMDNSAKYLNPLGSKPSAQGATPAGPSQQSVGYGIQNGQQQQRQPDYSIQNQVKWFEQQRAGQPAGGQQAPQQQQPSGPPQFNSSDHEAVRAAGMTAANNVSSWNRAGQDAARKKAEDEARAKIMGIGQQAPGQPPAVGMPQQPLPTAQDAARNMQMPGAQGMQDWWDNPQGLYTGENASRAGQFSYPGGYGPQAPLLQNGGALVQDPKYLGSNDYGQTQRGGRPYGEAEKARTSWGNENWRPAPTPGAVTADGRPYAGGAARNGW